MAEFCTKCAKELGFPEADIDILKIADLLLPGQFLPGVLCEGCDLVGVHKNDKGEIEVITIEEGKEEWIPYNKWINKNQQQQNKKNG